MTGWPRLFSGWARQPFEIAPLETGHARDVARLHGEGGFSRGWDTSECAVLLADHAVVAEGAFIGSGNQLGSFILIRRAGDEAEVLSIVTTRASRRQGQARALLQSSLARLERLGGRSLFLEVAEINHAALGLYQSIGFKMVGRRTGYYPMPDGTRATALVMRRDLS
jgi:[ribosomal protein S18]-alanine N-acetyltransferase